jgi:hypothetical protein
MHTHIRRLWALLTRSLMEVLCNHATYRQPPSRRTLRVPNQVYDLVLSSVQLSKRSQRVRSEAQSRTGHCSNLCFVVPTYYTCWQRFTVGKGMSLSCTVRRCRPALTRRYDARHIHRTETCSAPAQWCAMALAMPGQAARGPIFAARRLRLPRHARLHPTENLLIPVAAPGAASHCQSCCIPGRGARVGSLCTLPRRSPRAPLQWPYSSQLSSRVTLPGHRAHRVPRAPGLHPKGGCTPARQIPTGEHGGQRCVCV